MLLINVDVSLALPEFIFQACLSMATSNAFINARNLDANGRRLQCWMEERVKTKINEQGCGPWLKWKPCGGEWKGWQEVQCTLCNNSVCDLGHVESQRHLRRVASHVGIEPEPLPLEPPLPPPPPAPLPPPPVPPPGVASVDVNALDLFHNLENVKEDVAEQTQKLENVKACMAEQTQKLENVKASLAEQNAGLAEQNASLAEQNAELTQKLENVNASLAAQNADLLEKCKSVEGRLSQLEAELDELKAKKINSLSGGSEDSWCKELVPSKDSDGRKD